MEKDETYSLIIKALVSEQGMTLEQIAREGHFSLQSIYNWENGDHLPHPAKREKLKEMAKAHNITHIRSSLDLTCLPSDARAILVSLYEYLLKENELCQSEADNQSEKAN